jgi:sulfur carrier protein ThiS
MSTTDVPSDAAAAEAAGPGGKRTIAVTLKLYATLTRFLPPEARRDNRIALTVDADATIESLLARANVPKEMAHLVLVNGFFVPHAARASRHFAEGDVIAVWPPVAGG